MKFSEMPYERVDLEQLKKDFAHLRQTLAEAPTGQAAFAAHQQYYRLTDHVQTMMTIAQIRHDVDVTDEYYSKEQDFYDKAIPIYQNLVVEYQKQLYHSPHRAYLKEKIGPVAFKNMELAMKAVDERILPLMQEENALQSEYNKLLATAKVKWNEETLNLSLMEPYLYHHDRAVRKEAWEAYAWFFVDHQDQLDEIYDRLVKNRTRQGETLGYKNYLPVGDARMQRNCYDRDDLARFRRQVKEDLVPYAEELHEKRRRRLGLDHLMYYDEGAFFTGGNPSPTGTPEEILAAGRQMYRELSPETAEFMDFMCDNELFDVLGRKTKKTGGYMTYLPDYESPFIFANFNGTSGDADVITHECGHAFQGFLSGKDPIREHMDITMETAETHSMAMEFFTEPWMPLLFGKTAKAYIDMHLEASILFVPYGTMVDEFQHIAYTNPELTPAQRHGVWKDLERQYKPHLDYTGNPYYEAGGFWQNKHHIYDCPLYYIDYCIASANALQYKVWMDRDFRGAWESYLKLCRLSATDFFFGLMEKSGLRNPFEDGALAEIVRQLKGTK